MYIKKTQRQDPAVKNRWMWNPKREEMRGKTRPISLEQPTGAFVNANLDAAPQEADGDHDDKRRRIDELVSPVSTVAQDEV